MKKQNDQKTKDSLYSKLWGLTGIIGSGKTTVANLFRKQGAAVFDADSIVHELYNCASPEYPELLRRLNTAFEPMRGIFTAKEELKSDFSLELPQGGIDRKKMSQIVFSSAQARKSLEEIVHPLVYKSLVRKVQNAKSEKNVFIYDVPLLFETHLQKHLKGTIVVYAPEILAISRAAERMNLSVKNIAKRVKAQISIEKKRQLADYVIDNSGELTLLAEKVAKILERLQREN